MKNEEIIFAAISIIAGLVVLSTLAWVFLKYPTEQALGQRFVKDEFIFHTPFYMFHFKPITILVISIFVFGVCGLESLRNHLLKLPLVIKRVIFIFFFTAIFVFGYETLHMFLMWTATITVTGEITSLDEIISKPNPLLPYSVNFTFITKWYSLLLFLSLYGLYFMHQIMKASLNYKK